MTRNTKNRWSASDNSILNESGEFELRQNEIEICSCDEALHYKKALEAILAQSADG